MRGESHRENCTNQGWLDRMARRHSALITSGLLLSACATDLSHTESSAVFRSPSDYVGKQVRVCGYIHDSFEDANIWPSRSASQRDTVGLGLISNRAQGHSGPLHNQTRCVKGVVVRTGCAAENICTGSNFPYALKLADGEYAENWNVGRVSNVLSGSDAAGRRELISLD